MINYSCFCFPNTWMTDLIVVLSNIHKRISKVIPHVPPIQRCLSNDKDEKGVKDCSEYSKRTTIMTSITSHGREGTTFNSIKESKDYFIHNRFLWITANIVKVMNTPTEHIHSISYDIPNRSHIRRVMKALSLDCIKRYVKTRETRTKQTEKPAM